MSEYESMSPAELKNLALAAMRVGNSAMVEEIREVAYARARRMGINVKNVVPSDAAVNDYAATMAGKVGSP